jgi:hypothetical protein
MNKCHESDTTFMKNNKNIKININCLIFMAINNADREWPERSNWQATVFKTKQVFSFAN